MVEPQGNYSTRTPTPSSPVFPSGGAEQALSSPIQTTPTTPRPQNGNGNGNDFPSNGRSGWVDTDHRGVQNIKNSAFPLIYGHANPPGIRSTSPRSSMQRDASSKAPAVRDRSRPDNQRRRQSHLTPNPRSFPPNPPQPSPGYLPSHPAASSSGPPPAANTGHGGSNYHYPYSQRPLAGFYGQYTVPPPATMNPGHGLPYHYPHTFQPPPGDTSMGQGNYPQMLQSSGQSYHYPPGDSTSPNPPYSTPPHSTPYHSHPSSINPNSSPRSYMAGHFSSMGYPSPMGSQPYPSFPHQYTPPASVYGAYGALPYPHALSPPPQDGAWYYVAHGTAPPQQYQYDDQHLEEGFEPQYPSLNQDSRTAHSQPSSSHRPRPPIRASSGPTVTAAPATPSAAPPAPSSPPPAGSPSSKPVLRREWHPRPPPQRSPWVMWVGNVPSDATQEELWTFFTSGAADDSMGASDVVSIFLIARSSCAFVNYASEEGLERAISNFNGLALRPDDLQCPKLVCKVRKSTDDLKSGVGGQRGIGLHKQWVRDQKKLQGQGQDGWAQGMTDGPLSPSNSEDPGGRQNPEHSSSSESYTSTTSSLLGEHFPTRYFILKSLSDRDLELSVESGLWATQRHNELVLDRAYRTATDVFLIFSVNKSGEFYGYARMAGPIRRGEGNISWTSRSLIPSSPTPPYPLLVQPSRSMAASEGQLLTHGPIYDSPEAFRNDSAGATRTYDGQAIKEASGSPPHFQTAPAELGRPESSPLPEHSPSVKFSLDHHERRQNRAAKPGFQLDPEAPFRAMRGHAAAVALVGRQSEVESWERDGSLGEERAGVEGSDAKPSPTWGDCFKVEWVERRKIPFHKTRHLRNAWNKGREIKVSRDGTELESSVGKRLLEEWGELAGS